MEDLLQTIRSLIELSTSDNLDESRNAALAAVRLIRKNGILLTLPAPGNGTTFPAPSSVKKPAREPKKAKLDPNDWRPMRAKYDGTCKWCNKAIRPNAMIYWSKENGAYHAVCFLQTS